MTTGLGIVVGSVNSVAAVDPDGSAASGVSEHITITRRSTLQLSDNEAPVLGVDRQSVVAGRHSRDVLLDGFVGRVGDPVGILADDGTTYSGEDLTATAIGCLVDEASADLADRPTIVAAYPASWPHYTVDALRDALERAGFGDVTPVPEPIAAVRWLEQARGPLGEGAVVVYDLGGSTLDVTVVRTGEATGVLGKSIRSDDVSGAQFDHLTLQYVLANAVADQEINPFDPATEQALTELRSRCAEAKESLSSDTETALRVELPGVAQEVRLVRGELEDLLRQPLLTSIELVKEAVRMAGLELTDINQVQLVGGGARIPLVAELISSTLGLPVVASPAPDQTAAVGAAILATELGAESVALAEPIAAAAATAAPTSAVAVRPVVAPAPVAKTTPVVEATGMPRWKKGGIVAAVAVAIMLATAGGLSLGTGGDTNQSPESVPSQTNSLSAVPTSASDAGNSTAPQTSGSAPSTDSNGVVKTDAPAPGNTNNPGAPSGASGPTQGGDPTTGAPAGPTQGSGPETQAPAPPNPPEGQTQAPTQPQAPAPTPGPNSPYVPDDPNPNNIPGLPSLPIVGGITDQLPIVGNG